MKSIVRPLDKPGFRAQVAVKRVTDQSVDNLPRIHNHHRNMPVSAPQTGPPIYLDCATHFELRLPPLPLMGEG